MWTVNLLTKNFMAFPSSLRFINSQQSPKIISESIFRMNYGFWLQIFVYLNFWINTSTGEKTTTWLYEIKLGRFQYNLVEVSHREKAKEVLTSCGSCNPYRREDETELRPEFASFICLKSSKVSKTINLNYSELWPIPQYCSSFSRCSEIERNGLLREKWKVAHNATSVSELSSYSSSSHTIYSFSSYFLNGI